MSALPDDMDTFELLRLGLVLDSEQDVTDREPMDRPTFAIHRLKEYLAAPIGHPAEARLGVICLWLVQEIERLSGELDLLAEHALEDQRFGIAEEHEHSDPGPDGRSHTRSSGSTAVTHRDGRL